MLQVRNFF